MRSDSGAAGRRSEATPTDPLPRSRVDEGIGRGFAVFRTWLADRFELYRGTSGHNVMAMEGLRGFAVFLVFLVHFASLVHPYVDGNTALAVVFDGLHTVGNRGVDLFFVLSGYLIYGSLIARHQPFARFMRRRIERIYPTFLLVLAIYIVLSLFVPSERSTIPAGNLAAASYLLANVLLLPGLLPIEPIVTVAWSLSYEMFFYLALPFTVAILALRSRSRTWRIRLFALIGAAIVGYCLFRAGPVRLSMFIVGILLFEAITSGAVKRLGGGAAAALLGIALSATLIPTVGSAGYALKTLLLGGAFFALCWSTFTDPRGSLARVFGVKPLRWLGNMSYSYYLLHGLALNAAFVALAPLLKASADNSLLLWGWMPLLFAITLLPTAALFLFFERPISLAPRSYAASPGAVPTTG